METIGWFTGEHVFRSNFHPAAVVLDGVTYQTAEHAYQAAKTLDATKRDAIRRVDFPGKVKLAGMRVTLRPGWGSRKLEEMWRIVRDKFTRDPDLGRRLVET